MTHNFEEHRKMKRFFSIAFKIFFGILAAIAFALLFGYGIMWLWNWLMPEIFGLTEIGYWQAVGILVLAKVLFGGFGGHSSKKSSGKRYKRCRNKEKSTFKNDMAKWKSYDKFWKEEGESAYKAYVERLEEGETQGE